ncbi:MAG: CopG family antitoxin [Candidatus Desantisbacteria bacterium]|mgnify:CR=1 FL=1
MNKSNNTQLSSISKASTPEEIADFWDTHSLADYWDKTHEVKFEIRAKRRRRVTLDQEVYMLVEAQARTRGILPETLVNLWLAERFSKNKVGKQ